MHRTRPSVLWQDSTAQPSSMTLELLRQPRGLFDLRFTKTEREGEREERGEGWKERGDPPHTHRAWYISGLAATLLDTLQSVVYRYTTPSPGHHADRRGQSSDISHSGQRGQTAGPANCAVSTMEDGRRAPGPFLDAELVHCDSRSISLAPAA